MCHARRQLTKHVGELLSIGYLSGAFKLQRLSEAEFVAFDFRAVEFCAIFPDDGGNSIQCGFPGFDLSGFFFRGCLPGALSGSQLAGDIGAA